MRYGFSSYAGRYHAFIDHGDGTAEAARLGEARWFDTPPGGRPGELIGFAPSRGDYLRIVHLPRPARTAEVERLLPSEDRPAIYAASIGATTKIFRLDPSGEWHVTDPAPAPVEWQPSKSAFFYDTAIRLHGDAADRYRIPSPLGDRAALLRGFPRTAHIEVSDEEGEPVIACDVSASFANVLRALLTSWHSGATPVPGTGIEASLNKSSSTEEHVRIFYDGETYTGDLMGKTFAMGEGTFAELLDAVVRA